MMNRHVTGPELALVAGTRVVLGVGIGLLLSRKMNRDECKAAGIALVVTGALTTIPLAMGILGQDRVAEDWDRDRLAA